MEINLSKKKASIWKWHEMARNGTWAIDEKIIPLVNVTVEGIAVWFLPFSAFPARVNPRVR